MTFNLKARTIYLRLVKPEDAEFIYSLRHSDKLNQFISKVSDKIEDQRQWIIDYKKREARGEEYYFIVCRNADDLPIGTARLYDFQDNPKSFRWGSWILNDDKPRYGALESALLIYQAGFEDLGFEQGRFEVMKGNDKVHNFKLKMGSKPVSEDETFIYYTFSKEQYEINKRQYSEFLA